VGHFFEEELYFHRLVNLADKAAEALAKQRGTIHFDALTTISEETAEALAKHTGNLYLDSIKTLSDKAAQALANSDGWLSLDGLEELDDYESPGHLALVQKRKIDHDSLAAQQAEYGGKLQMPCLSNINFDCPNCHQSFTVDKSGAGSQIDCPTCHKPILIPTYSPQTLARTPEQGLRPCSGHRLPTIPKDWKG
jgi:hypothetical protein